MGDISCAVDDSGDLGDTSWPSLRVLKVWISIAPLLSSSVPAMSNMDARSYAQEVPSVPEPQSVTVITTRAAATSPTEPLQPNRWILGPEFG